MSNEPTSKPSKPPIVVTATGEHPAIVLPPETRLQLLAGVLIDLVALAGMIMLIALDKLTPTEGLPWIALLLGVKAAGVGRRFPPGAGGAIVSILGILNSNKPQ